jgi:hypothetical protein
MKSSVAEAEALYGQKIISSETFYITSSKTSNFQNNKNVLGLYNAHRRASGEVTLLLPFTLCNVGIPLYKSLIIILYLTKQIV